MFEAARTDSAGGEYFAGGVERIFGLRSIAGTGR
jgi:hypothetical protein